MTSLVYQLFSWVVCCTSAQSVMKVLHCELVHGWEHRTDVVLSPWLASRVKLQSTAPLQLQAEAAKRDSAQHETEALDAFMEGVAHAGAAADVKRLQHELMLTREQIKQTEELVQVADPMNEHGRRKPL